MVYFFSKKKREIYLPRNGINLCCRSQKCGKCEKVSLSAELFHQREILKRHTRQHEEAISGFRLIWNLKWLRNIFERIGWRNIFLQFSSSLGFSTKYLQAHKYKGSTQGINCQPNGICSAGFRPAKSILTGVSVNTLNPQESEGGVGMGGCQGTMSLSWVRPHVEPIGRAMIESLDTPPLIDLPL